MTLRRLALGSLFGALAGLAAISAVAMWVWLSASEQVHRLQTLAELHERIHLLRTGIDYTTQFRADPDLLRALAADARDLAGRTEATGAPSARRASLHLTEIAWIADELAELGERTGVDDARQAVLTDVRWQLQVHETAASETLEEIIETDYHRILETLIAALGTLIAAGAMLAVFGLLAFWRLNRRVTRPLALIERGMREMAAGRADSRIALDTRDELGELARTFNSMAAQRQQYETELKESEARFRQITESIGEVFWMTPPDGVGVLYVSPAYESIWGRPRQALYAHPDLWLQAIHPDDRGRIQSALQRGGMENFSAEYRVVRPDGEIRWIEDQSFPVRDTGGTLVRIVGVARDVTERQFARIQLGERIKELRCLYRVLELTTDSDRAVDVTCAEVAALLPPHMMHADDAVAWVEVDGRRYRSPDWQSPEDAIERPIHAAGAVVGRVSVGYRRSQPDAPGGEGPFLAEEVTLIHGVATHLGRMVDARRLADTLGQTERLKAVGELTGGIAHDFNNLLTVILGNAEIMADDLVSQQQRDTLAMIIKAAERGAELTRRLLAFARRQALAPCAVDINNLLKDMDGLLRHSLGPGVDLRLQPEPRLPAALVDPGQLENALLNLCLNARDAMAGSGQVTIMTCRRAWEQRKGKQVTANADAEYIMIAIADTGCGMSEETLRHAFEPFFSTKARDKGTGLGLSMVYGFVRQSNGQVEIESEPGRGTRVALYLPIARAHLSPGEAA